MTLYDQFLKRKQEGELLHLEELSSNDLEILFIEESKSDAMIALLFGVNSSKITYLRRKYGITLRNSSIKDYLDTETNVSVELNTNMKGQTLTSENITKISKAVTHFAFRNGPIEDMHADVTKNITDEDMTKLNKYMVNRVAYIFTLILEDRWMELNFLVENMNLMFGHHWDEAVQDDGGMRELFEKEINKLRN